MADTLREDLRIFMWLVFIMKRRRVLCEVRIATVQTDDDLNTTVDHDLLQICC
jgi:hypothetical protein